jgi:DNA modification methylase
MNTVLHGDAEMLIPTLPFKVHLTVTSPPYFNVKDYVNYESYDAYLNTLRRVFLAVLDVTHPGRMCCVNLSNILIPRESRSKESKRIPLAFHFVPLMEQIGWKFIEDIQWVKPEGAAKNRNGGFFQHRQPLAYKPNTVNEYILVFQKPCTTLIDQIVRSYDAQTAEESKVGAYERSNVWHINPETRSKHPAPYPEELVDKLVRYYSYVGDVVLDPYMGSGTTAVVAKRLNRAFTGCELHDEYIQMTTARLNKTTPVDRLPPLRMPDMETVEDLTAWLNAQSKRIISALVPSRKSESKSTLITRITTEWAAQH